MTTPSAFNELSHQCDVASVRSVQFALLGPEEIRKRSVAEIKTTDTFSGSVQIPNGLFDQRMGVVEHGRACQTCHQGYSACPGHMGHIELACPVFHVHFFKMIVNVLKCVCWRCSKLLVHPGAPEIAPYGRLPREKRWDAVRAACRAVRRCSREDGCGALQPTKTARHDDKFLKCEMTWEGLASGDEVHEAAARAANDGTARLTIGAPGALQILSRIPDADAAAMGFRPGVSRPEWMIATVLPVPPPSVRPSAKNDMGQRAEDDITIVLCNIIKTNQAIAAKASAGTLTESSDQHVQLLQYYVATMVDNTIPNMSPATQRTGRSIKSISERLKGKEGRVRGNLLGKRVDYSARSVITPDPSISVVEIGVPVRVATTLTFPETVNDSNFSRLEALVKAGSSSYPGARFVQKAADGMRIIQLREGRPPPALSNGDVVHRHLANGDFVLFNRQPSLHKMSMMAHRVRVMTHNTFRLNACVTPAYNADFDGDEMNAHLPVTPFTMTEIALLAAVPMHALSPKHSSPIMAVVQDVALAVHLITLPGVSVPARLMCNLMCCIPAFSGELGKPAAKRSGGDRGAPSWTGRQALSAVIPEGVAASVKTSAGRTHIKNGIISEDGAGGLVKGAYQADTKGLVHIVFNDMGPQGIVDMIDGTQRIACAWLAETGFSVGLSDVTMPDATLVGIRAQLAAAEAGVNGIIDSMHSNGWRPKQSMNSPADDLESEINNRLNGVRKELEDSVRSRVPPDNRIMQMITAGSKGSMTNMVQMTATLGQQNVDMRRPGYGFEGRTLPHYCKFDDGPEARGFVRNSFASGLSPPEFLFHSMAGRVGLIDTAVRTSESGYISRKLVKAMEDCKVAADGSVRNALGQVVQFVYGEDGMDTVSIETQELPHLAYDGDRMADSFLIPDAVARALLDDGAFARHSADPLIRGRLLDHFGEIMRDRSAVILDMHQGRMDPASNTEVRFAVNISRIVSSALQAQHLSVPRGLSSDLEPSVVLDELDRLRADLAPGPAHAQCPVFGALLRANLSPRALLAAGMLKETFLRVVTEIRERFDDSVVQTGEMVGMVSAQSLGEPTTQLTLNTFHLAGVSSVSKAVSGLPRLMELLNVTPTPKRSLTYVHLPAGMKHSREAAFRVKSKIENTRLVDIVSRSSVYFDPTDSRVDEDKGVVQAYRALVPERCPSAAASPWVTRLELDRARMLEHDVCMIDVSDAIKRFYRDAVSCMHSDDNEERLVFRIRLTHAAALDEDALTEVRAFEAAMLESVFVKPSIGITFATPMQPAAVQTHEFDAAVGSFSPCLGGAREWVLETDGRDLSEILASPLVDSTCTQSNDICETLRVLGVEAARRKLFDELHDVLKDSEINPRHILLLVDNMTFGGGLTSINRHGINRGDIGPLAKCSFEQTTEKLTNAAIFSEEDRMNGVSACIMLGQIPPGGTGGVRVALDESALNFNLDVEHPSRIEIVAAAPDAPELCSKILRFAPLDLSADDGWGSRIAKVAVRVIKK